MSSIETIRSVANEFGYRVIQNETEIILCRDSYIYKKADSTMEQIPELTIRISDAKVVSINLGSEDLTPRMNITDLNENIIYDGNEFPSILILICLLNHITF